MKTDNNFLLETPRNITWLHTSLLPIASNKKQVSSSVWLWKFRINTSETFTMTNLSDAKKSNDLVLKQFKAWVRPFLRVEWN